jgi:hypothetical protein
VGPIQRGQSVGAAAWSVAEATARAKRDFMAAEKLRGAGKVTPLKIKLPPELPGSAPC